LQEPVQARKGADPLRVTVAYRCKGRRKHREKLAHKPGGDCRRARHLTLIESDYD
jgi:hypothetical protein